MNVELIAYTPEPDELCAISASTCVSVEIPEGGAHTVRLGEKPKLGWALTNALASGHESVIEHASFTFAVSGVSRALTHQLVRHRIASYSQQSQRYVDMSKFGYVVPESISRRREEELVDPYFYLQEYEHLMDEISKLYQGMVMGGIPEEDARYILPNACCTNIVVTMNARQLHKFFMIRMCNRAQWEIRELAERMLYLCKEVAPIIFENAGPQCVKLGYCPEKRSCGRCPKLKTLLDKDFTT